MSKYIPWSKGLTVLTDFRIARLAEACKKANTGRSPWNKGKQGFKTTDIDFTELRDLYLNKKLSMKDCGKHFNCSGHTIADRLKVLNITIRPMKGDTHSLKGKKPSIATRKKISKTLGGTGDLVSRKGYKGFTYDLRDSVRKRDNYCCQECGFTNEESLVLTGRSLPVHHIDYNKKNSVPENLISLCDFCHTKTNVDRDYWKEYFQIKMKALQND